jgi:hypothetical protein
MKNNHVSSIDSALEKLEVLNSESSKNIVGGKIRVRVVIEIV